MTKQMHKPNASAAPRKERKSGERKRKPRQTSAATKPPIGDAKEQEEMQPVSFSIPKRLHKKIKIACALREISMTDEFIRLLSEEFDK